MTKDDLTALGLSEADVFDRLVERLANQFVDDESEYSADFQKRVNAALKARVDEVLNNAMKTHVLPKINEMIDGVCLQETNSWGEKTGKPVTFIEYLVQRVDHCIREMVDRNGKTRAEDSYNWSASTTRISYMINEHLKYSIQKAMEEALGKVNSSVRKGLEEAVNLALKSVQVVVKTEVKS